MSINTDPRPTDLATVHTDLGLDWSFEGTDLAMETSLRTAILNSLFSDARYEEDTDPPDLAPDDGKRGWWPDVPGDRWGSKLWLLARSKMIPETFAQASQWAREALQWMVDEQIGDEVQVEADAGAGGLLRLHLQIYRGRSSRWSGVWISEDSAIIPSVAEIRISTY